MLCLFISKQQKSLFRHRGLSRALKMPHWGIFSDRDVPWAYGLAVSAAASHSRPRWCTETAVPSKTSNKKYPAASCEVFCGAPCGNKPEHFCVSGRHRHHTAAHPEVMPVVPPREDKRGMLKYQGAFAAYPRSTNWAAVFHSPLDISPSLFFRLIAEQPTSPYPDGIT